MWSRTDGANAASEMICGRAPLPGTMSITDSGAQVSATVGLKDALDYRIITRKAARAGLESVFVNVIEARTPQQKPEIKDVTIEQTSVSGSCGVTVAFKLTNGDNGVFSSTLNSDGVIEHNNLKRTGRMAALLPQSGRMALTDGSRFEAEGWKLELQQSWRMNLDGVIGDLTGETQQSALIVKSTMPLPTDDTLKGQFIYVQHQVNQAFQSIYSIEKISVYGKNLWRIDLSGTPPFIIQRSTVLQVNAADPRKMEQTFQFMTLFGTANTAGHRVHFPRSGFESRLVETGRSAFTIFNSPVAGQVIKGDAFVIYTIQKGGQGFNSVQICLHRSKRPNWNIAARYPDYRQSDIDHSR